MDQAGARQAFEIDLARDFSDAPLGRTRKQGRFSGEAFREDHLKKALRTNDFIVVNLDGASGLSTGFLDEAFAGLVRDGTLGEEDFWRRIEIIATRDPIVLVEIKTFVSRAAVRSGSN